MIKLQLISRVVLIQNDKILLFKKIGADFWHYPGGKWEFEKESLAECARREIKEETGYDIIIGDLIWSQEIRKPEKVYVELFWHAKISANNTQKSTKIVDIDKTDEDIGYVKWFKIKDLGTIKVLPKEVYRNISRNTLSSNVFNVES